MVVHFPVAAAPLLGGDAVNDLVAAAGAGGSGSYLDLVASDQAGQATLTARLNPRSGARAGSSIRLAVDVERLHFFDPETEQAIW